ncbi:HNH endonuclease [Burkholderia vietnamiensis]|uniref:HNH endonuclease n=1 Tax=Burkholderia vietnamiensis TaxID=60552 RepID=UPI00264B7CA2|nr:hypothetical protein [Burkholderia vietnamiensis]MDN7926932.1 hypothetical protein [Burkholderia vietnamiensis]
MGSKRFRNKTCVYCGLEQGANTADHVIAREFFLLAGRDNLPKVPACQECNTAKSRLEHYVLSVLLMGGVHPDAIEALATQLGPRLANNDALRRALFVGQRDRLIRQPDGSWATGMSVPFDGEQLAILCCYIALGLAWHHWHLQIAPHAVASANMFTRPGQATFEDLLARCEAGGRVEHTIGNGVFAYRGVYLRTNPRITLWQMKFFGGVELGSHRQRGETARSLFVATNDAPDWIAARNTRRVPGRAPIGLGAADSEAGTLATAGQA